MRIGLVRHFRVEQAVPQGWKTAGELQAWRERYDCAPISPASVDLGPTRWARCICSDAPRALKTAEVIHSGPVEVTPLLREFDFAEFRTGSLRLPVGAWKWVLRLAWTSGHGSQRAARDDFRQRVQAMAQMLDAETEPLLVVSHGGMMMHLARELIRRGFAGPKLGVADHAKLYLYERDEAAPASFQGGRILSFICGAGLKKDESLQAERTEPRRLD